MAKKILPARATGRRRGQRLAERLPLSTKVARSFAALHDPDAPVAPLSQDEIGFLYIYAACGDKRLALALSSGLDVQDWPAWKVYEHCQRFLIRAALLGDWKDALRRHELTLDDLAAHLKRLLTCGNPHAEVNALKLALLTGGLLERGDHAATTAGPGATFHFHLTAPPATAPADGAPQEPRNVTPHRKGQPFVIEPEDPA
jgi:hypothetical protein